MKDFADFLNKADPTELPFAMIPNWLIGQVNATALMVYAHISRRCGPDGWCWFKRDDFVENVKPIKWTSFSHCLDQLEAVGAVVVFNRRTAATRGKPGSGGKNGGFVFYRHPTLRPIERSADKPITFVAPTRIPGAVGSRHPDVLVRRPNQQVAKAGKTQDGPKRALARDGKGRFVKTQDGHDPILPTGPERDFGPCQDGPNPTREQDPVNKTPDDEQEPVRVRQQVRPITFLFAKAVA